MTAVMEHCLKDKSIVIIGGTSGLGLSAAQACVAAGASVVVVGRTGAKADALVATSGSRVQVIEADATMPATAELAVSAAVRSFHGLDGLYHVAGGSGRSHGDGPLDQLSDDGWHFTLRQNLDAVFYSNRSALQQFLRQGRGGSLLNMASVLGYSPSPAFFATHAYAAAKAAIIGMTRSAAAYYASRNIRVNAVAPALVDTPMAQRAAHDEKIMRYVRRKQPLDGGRIGRPSDVDDAVLYFLSDASRFVTGQLLAIDGGWCVSDVTDGSEHETAR